MEFGRHAEREDPLWIGVPEVHVGRDRDVRRAELIDDDRVDRVVERSLLVVRVAASSAHDDPADPAEDTLDAVVEQPRTDLLDRRFVLRRLEEQDPARPPRLEVDGSITVDGRTVTLDEVTVPRPGQSFAYVLDSAWCDGALERAAGADLLLCESTFLSTEEHLAERYGHLTARQAGRLAAESGARKLVLTHFSPRYDSEDAFTDEAAEEFDGEVVLATDFDRIPVPPRR